MGMYDSDLARGKNFGRGQSLLESLRKQEEDFLNREFICLSYRGLPLTVHISGITMSLKPNRSVNGLGIYKPVDYKIANYVRRPSIKERAEYLNLFPRVEMIMSDSNNGYVVSDQRFPIEVPIKIMEADGLSCFDYVYARFTGQFFIYECPVRARVRKSNEFCEAIKNVDDEFAKTLSGNTLTLYLKKLEDELRSRIPPDEQRLRQQVERAGAVFNKYKKVGNQFVVDYTVDDFSNSCTVNSDDLSVTLAGICLGHGNENMVSSGLLDLNSLVSVTKEAINTGNIVRGNFD